MDKITKGDNESQSTNVTQENINQLKQLFPEIVTEGKIDFKALQEILGEEVEEGDEYYRFTWAGKAQARKEALKPSTGTLRPAAEESVNWNRTQNLYLEGDNLEVLKLMQKSYAGKVKMIYIDPPYNTGKDFVYKDNYKDNLKNYQELTGQVDSEGNKLSTNSDSDGRYHSNWLNMMYPRLRLARNLLSDDGVIFMSIDDNEVENLKKIGNEIFGEINFIDTLKWKRKKQPSFLAKHTAKVMEYILVYSKRHDKLEKLSIYKTSDLTKKVINISNEESTRKFDVGVRVKGETNGIIPKGRHTIRTMEIEYDRDVVYKGGYTVNEVIVTSKFSTSQENIDQYITDDLLFITSNMGLRRDVGQEEIGKRKSITDLLLKNWGDNQESDNELRDLFHTTEYFDYTKPTLLIKNLTQSNFTENEIILDFFSGSATTAHAVMQLNAEDGGNRKYIQVQLPEPTDEKSEAHKAGYKKITEIGKERIRRAGKKILEELDEKIAVQQDHLAKAKTEEEKEKIHQEINSLTEKKDNLDVGFKVFKLDSSNIHTWDDSVDDVEQNLFNSIESIKDDRSTKDVLYEILLKYGLDLSLPIEQKEIAGKTVYNIGAGALFICLDNEIPLEVAEGLGKWKKELGVADEDSEQFVRVVFKDAGLTDVVKTNAIQTLKRYGITDVKSI